MIKKMCSILAVLFIITYGSFVVSFASGNEMIYDKHTASTEQFLVTITRPDGDERTFKKSYVICGVSDEEDIRVELLIYNKYTDCYEPFTNTDGESSWDIGSSGIFMREVELPDEDANKIRIVAYKKINADNLEPGVNLQVNNFTVTVLSQTFKNIINDGMLKITNLFKGILGN